jgi:hypothetical protein
MMIPLKSLLMQTLGYNQTRILLPLPPIFPSPSMGEPALSRTLRLSKGACRRRGQEEFMENVVTIVRPLITD